MELSKISPSDWLDAMKRKKIEWYKENGLKVPNFDKEEDYFFVNAVENQVRRLVDVELAAANERFPQFHSTHEGYAVILEEVNELSAETALVEKTTNELWEDIKRNKRSGVIEYDADWIGRYAINAACEAIQVAAMCRKFLEMEGKR